MTVEAADKTKVLIDKALASIGDIATLPEVTIKIIELVEDPKSTARDLHEVIKNDPALSVKVLKVVNSAFYGLPGQVASVDRAIILLGLSAVKNIAIAASIARLFKGKRISEHFTAADLLRNHPELGKHLPSHAGDPHFQALKIADGFDFLTVPARHLRTGIAGRKLHDVVLLEYLAHQVDAAAVIHPCVLLPCVHPKRNRGIESERRILAYVVIAC